jgi:hypothetical protein
MANRTSKMEINMKAIITIINSLEKELTFGKMGLIISAISRIICGMAEEYGGPTK